MISCLLTSIKAVEVGRASRVLPSAKHVLEETKAARRLKVLCGLTGLT
jgi:hypothetical protein